MTIPPPAPPERLLQLLILTTDPEEYAQWVLENEHKFEAFAKGEMEGQLRGMAFGFLLGSLWIKFIKEIPNVASDETSEALFAELGKSGNDSL